MIPSNSIFLSVPGWATAATFLPASGDTMPIVGIKTNPPITEEVSVAQNVVYFWVDGSAITPLPQPGDRLLLDSANYDIERTAVDISGQQGMLLVLRRA